MAQAHSPNPPRGIAAFVGQDGRLTNEGLSVLTQMWRQVAAGFVAVPVAITGTNDLVLTPTLNDEGARTVADHMAFAGVAAADSTGVVTATLGDDLGPYKVYKDRGATQATSGDLLAGRFYTFWYVAALDSDNGGFVIL